MFAQAYRPNVAQHLRILHRAIPLACSSHENRDGLLRVDVHMDHPALRTIAFSTMVVGRVEPHGFLCPALPLKYLLLRKRLAGAQKYNQGWNNFGDAHSKASI